MPAVHGQLVAACGRGNAVAAQAGAVFVEKRGLVVNRPSVAVCRVFAERSVAVRSFRDDLVLTFFRLGPDGVHGHLCDPSSVAPPVGEFRPVDMAAEDDGVPRGKFPAEVEPGLGMCGFGAAVEEPSAGGGIVWKDRPVDHDEGVPGLPGLLQQFVHFFVVRMVEVDDDVGVGSDPVGEGRLGDGLPEFFAHALGHEIVINGFGVRPADVVVAHHRHQRQGAAEGGLE